MHVVDYSFLRVPQFLIDDRSKHSLRSQTRIGSSSTAGSQRSYTLQAQFPALLTFQSLRSPTRSSLPQRSLKKGLVSKGRVRNRRSCFIANPEYEVERRRHLQGRRDGTMLPSIKEVGWIGRRMVVSRRVEDKLEGRSRTY